MSDNPLKPLDDEQIEGAAGGYLFDTYELEGGYSCLRKPFEVVDNKGEVIGSFWSSDDAKLELNIDINSIMFSYT